MSSEMAYDAEGVPNEVGKYASQLPEPSGFRMLLALPEMKEETDGGIFIPENRLHDEKAASVVGMVLKQGPDCYNDEKRFPSGPWCKEGDWVCIRSFSGDRINIQGKEFRLISDDNILAVVQDPRGVSRVSGA